MQTLETPRLILRDLDMDDSSFILKLVNTESWLRFIGDRGIHTLLDAKTYIVGGPIHSYLTMGFGFQLVMLKETQTAIGLCGLVKRDSLDHVDLGFAFLPEYEGKGYGFEAAQAALNHAQTVLLKSTVLAITNKDNIRSIALLNKLGFKLKGDFTLPEETEPLNLFSIES